jgi:hypothetical protein
MIRPQMSTKHYAVRESAPLIFLPKADDLRLYQTSVRKIYTSEVKTDFFRDE